MATTHLIGFLQSGIVTSAGVALASGKVRFYQPGTLTPETVYSDGAGASPITQPVTLSAGGTATVYSLNPIRCQIKDATDVTLLFDLDQADTVSGSGISIQSATFNNNVAFTSKAAFDAWSTSFGGTAGLWKGKIGTTERNVKDMISGIAISVLDYGAVGDDATDNGTAINNALTAVGASGGGSVLFPPGIFRHSIALNVPAGVSIRGSGQGSTRIKGTNATANCLVVTGTSSLGAVLSDFSLDHATASTGIAISLSGSSAKFNVSNVSTRVGGGAPYTTGISFTGGSGGICTGCTLLASGANNILLNGASDVVFVGCLSSGISIDGSTNDVRFVAHADNTGTTTAVTWSGARIAFIASNMASMVFNGTGTGVNAAPQITTTGCFQGSATGSVATLSITDNTTGNGNHFAELYQPSNAQVGPSVSVAGGASTTPDFRKTPGITVRATSAGTVTINNPTTDLAYGAVGNLIRGVDIKINCLNFSGGAVTFAFGALYKTTGAVAPASGSSTVVTFSLFVDVVGTFFRETSRATTT